MKLKIITFVVSLFILSYCRSQSHPITIHPNQRVVSLLMTPGEYSAWVTNDEYTNNSTKRQALTKDIYKKFEDKFDFIFLVLNEATQPANLNYAGQLIRTANSVTGIGPYINVENFDGLYGSAGRLKSVMALTAKDYLLYGPSLHELMHNWGNYLINTKGWNGSAEYNAVPHWGYMGGSTKGQLGGFQQSTLQTNVGGILNKYSVGSFGWNANGGNSVPYTDLELYLMGMIPITSVANFNVFSGISQAALVGSNIEFTASTKTTYDNNKILADAGGARNPSSVNSQKDYRLLVVVLTATPLTEAQWSVFDDQSEKFGRTSSFDPNIFNFWAATKGIGTMQTGNLSDAIIIYPKVDSIVYTFIGNGNWSDTANWLNKNVPPDVLTAGSKIIINPVSNGECVLDVPQAISFGASISVEPNKKFKVAGGLENFDAANEFKLDYKDVELFDSLAAPTPLLSEIKDIDGNILGNPLKQTQTLSIEGPNVLLKKSIIFHMIDYARLLSNQKSFQHKDGIEPEHYGYAYRFGGNGDDKNLFSRLNPTDADDLHMRDAVYGTDCIGFLINLLRQAGLKMELCQSISLETTLRRVLKNDPVYKNVQIENKGFQPIGQLKTGDFIVWEAKGHSALFCDVFDNTSVIFNSNGQPKPKQAVIDRNADADPPIIMTDAQLAAAQEKEQEKNYGLRRGIHAIKFNDALTASYWGLNYEALRLESVDIETAPITSLTSTGAISGGSLNYSGAYQITAGVMWSKQPDFRVIENRTTDATTNGDYTSKITFQTPGVTYYVRSYVALGFGTQPPNYYYGNSVSTQATEGNFVDVRDNKVYPYKTFGTQVWMTKNLNYSPTFCTNCALYGGLYDWNAANSFVPAGWHLPSDAEWTTLTTYLGGTSVAGTAMADPNGFNALFGGFITNAGTPYGVGTYTGWWTSTPSGSHDEHYRLIGLGNSGVYSSGIYAPQQYGWAIRCIRD